MKKWKQVVLVAALALLLGLTSRTESQAAGITGVKQTDAGKNSVTVACDAALQAKYYILEVSSDGQSWIHKDHSSTPNDLTASGLSAGATYYVRVTGATNYEYADFSTYEITWDACTEPSAPLEVVTVPDSASAKLVQTGAALNSVTVEVTGVTGANYYVLGSSGSYSNMQAFATSATPAITAASLIPNTSYTMHAYACRKAASTGYIAHPDWDTCADYSVKTLTPKINTKNFGVTGAWSNINSYNFGVSDGFAADGYQFQFQTMKGKVKKTVYTTSTTVGLDRFINGTFYKYRVRPYVDCGTNKAHGEWSSFRYIGVSKDVNGTSRTKGKKRTLRLSWKKVSGASKYIVYISKSEKGGYKKVKTLSAKKNSIKITKFGKKKLKKNTTYYIKLVTKGKSGKKTVNSDVNKIMTSTY